MSHKTSIGSVILLVVASLLVAWSANAQDADASTRHIKRFRKSWFELGFGVSTASRLDQANGMGAVMVTYTYVPDKFIPIRAKWLAQVAFESYGQTSGEIDVLLGALTNYNPESDIRSTLFIGVGYYTGERITERVNQPGGSILGIPFPPQKYAYKEFQTLGVPVEWLIQVRRVGVSFQGNINMEMRWAGFALSMKLAKKGQ